MGEIGTMQAQDKSFSFMSTQSYYDIPFFQRAYVWGRDNWEELMDNLSDDSQNHFLGSIILKNEMVKAGDVARYLIIDGQQRLTTLSVLLRACFDHIKENNDIYKHPEELIASNKGRMEDLLFVSTGGFSGKKEIKLNHSHLDKTAYEKVIKGELSSESEWKKYVTLDEYSDSNAIIRAYAFFREALNNLSLEQIDKLWDLLTKDNVRFLVNIDLGADDNEQAIFDTVNSAGVRLSGADTIKNLLFQKYVELLRKEEPHSADALAVQGYENTWGKTFLADEETDAYWSAMHQYGRMTRSNLETFLHAFAVIKGFFNPAENYMKDLPQEYRKVVAKMSREEIENFLSNMCEYAEVFHDYFFKDVVILGYEKYIERLFNICGSLEVATFYPYILKRLFDKDNNKVTEEIIKEEFFALEKYVILTAICKGSTKNYNNECLQLVEQKKTPQEIIEDSQYIFDEAFENGIRRMTANKLPTLLLFWIELYKRNTEKVDIKELQYSYSLEHIMPQKWQQNWSDVKCYDVEEKEILNKDEIAQVRGHAIYEIGNMTLLNLKLNTSVSNGTFKDKINGKSGKKGMKDLADLMLTKEVTANSEWDERKIYNRTKELGDLIRSIWKVSTLPAEKAVVKKSKPKKKTATSIKEVRKQYWGKLLPKLYTAFDSNGPFVNVNPVKDNWICGWFGISGFSITCAVTEKAARVELSLSSSRKDKNIKGYSFLESQKEYLENELGPGLIWSPASDSKKQAQIKSPACDFLLYDESTWEKAINYQLEWCKKFYSVAVPILWEEFVVHEKGLSDKNISDQYALIPDGKYYCNKKTKTIGELKATMEVQKGKFVVLAGSQCLPCEKEWMPEARKTAEIVDGVLQKDVVCNSPSTAGWVVLGRNNKGWSLWKDETGKAIKQYRKKDRNV